ncbi:exodeoxyribonuclease VII large subunit [Curtobacterium sp. L1-20]|uniref:DUF4190 domain-containing protein n=1 Tax=Curtobacterium sp. L1-20 TaxID=3138181 RepID=UPI003B51710D
MYATHQQLMDVLPGRIRRIHLVSGPQSQARLDFTDPLLRPHREMVEHHFVPLEAAGSAAALARTIEALPVTDDAVVVLTRGGGDLSVFDDAAVTAAVRMSLLPVVTAVGHTSDRTRAEEVADASLPTPSRAGEAMKRVLAAQWHERNRSARIPPVPEPVARSPRVTPVPPVQTMRPTLTPPPYAPPSFPVHTAPPMPSYPIRARRSNPLATASVVLGVVSMFTLGGLGIGAIVGTVLGLVALRDAPRTAAVWGVVLNGLCLVGIAAAVAALVAVGSSTRT